MTTVGFGDLYPVTGAGRSVATVAMIVGMFATAMPVTVLGNRFAEEYDREEYKKLHTHYMVLDSIAMGLLRFFHASKQDDAKELIKENLHEVEASRDIVRKRVAETDMKVKIRFLEEDLGHIASVITQKQLKMNRHVDRICKKISRVTTGLQNPDSDGYASDASNASDDTVASDDIAGQETKRLKRVESDRKFKEEEEGVHSNQEAPATRKASFKAAKMFMPFNATDRKLVFFPSQTRQVKIREASTIFEAFDEDSSGLIGKPELLAIMDYLEITEDRCKRAVHLIFGAEKDGFLVDKQVFNLWLRNIDLMQRVLNPYERIYFLLEDPSCCALAMIISTIMLLLIVASVIALMCESLAGYNSPRCHGCEPELSDSAFNQMELVAVVIFTLEYVVRLGCVPFVKSLNQSVVTSNVQRFLKFEVNHKKPAELLIEAKHANKIVKVLHWLRKPMNVIDLLAIAPFYAELAAKKVVKQGGGGLMVLRVLRLARLFRIVKLHKYSSGVKVFTSTVGNSAPALSVLVFVLMLMIILFGQLLFLAESGSWYKPDDICGTDPDTGAPATCSALSYVNGTYLRYDVNGDLGTTPFKNAFDASWCILATMTTVSSRRAAISFLHSPNRSLTRAPFWPFLLLCCCIFYLTLCRLVTVTFTRLQWWAEFSLPSQWFWACLPLQCPSLC
jgi:hypothetical protein